MGNQAKKSSCSSLQLMEELGFELRVAGHEVLHTPSSSSQFVPNWTKKEAGAAAIKHSILTAWVCPHSIVLGSHSPTATPRKEAVTCNEFDYHSNSPPCPIKGLYTHILFHMTLAMLPGRVDRIYTLVTELGMAIPLVYGMFISGFSTGRVFKCAWVFLLAFLHSCHLLWDLNEML